MAAIEICQNGLSQVAPSSESGATGVLNVDVNSADHQQSTKSVYTCLELSIANTTHGVPLEYAIRDYFHNLLTQDTAGDIPRRHITSFPPIMFIQPASGVTPRQIKMDGMLELPMGRFGIPYSDYVRLERIDSDLERARVFLSTGKRLDNLSKVIQLIPALQHDLLGSPPNQNFQQAHTNSDVVNEASDGNGAQKTVALGGGDQKAQEKWDTGFQRLKDAYNLTLQIYRIQAERFHRT